MRVRVFTEPQQGATYDDSGSARWSPRRRSGRVELGLAPAGSRPSTPPVGERFDRLEEQLAIVTGSWAPRPTGGSRTVYLQVPRPR